MLTVGQILNIPSSTSASYIEYTVKPGDSLWLIAQTYNTTVNALKNANGLTGDLINVGQVLKIPLS